MSWSLVVVPLHALSRDGMSEWVMRAAVAADAPAGEAFVVWPGDESRDDWPW